MIAKTMYSSTTEFSISLAVNVDCDAKTISFVTTDNVYGYYRREEYPTFAEAVDAYKILEDIVTEAERRAK